MANREKEPQKKGFSHLLAGVAFGKRRQQFWEPSIQIYCMGYKYQSCNCCIWIYPCFLLKASNFSWWPWKKLWSLTSFWALVTAITLLEGLLNGDLSVKLSLTLLLAAAFPGRMRADSLAASPPTQSSCGWFTAHGNPYCSYSLGLCLRITL